MNTEPQRVNHALQGTYLKNHPGKAAVLLEKLPASQIGGLLSTHPLNITLPVWERLVSEIASSALEQLPEEQAKAVLTDANPSRSAAWLSHCNDNKRSQLMALLNPELAKELQALLEFPPDSAGSLMDPRVLVFRPSMSVAEGLQHLRSSSRKDVRTVFMVDDQGRLSGFVSVQSLALADPHIRLQRLMQPVATMVDGVALRAEVVEKLDEYRLTDLPVVDADGQLIGVIRPHELMSSVEKEASATLQTMVGVSKTERALSSVGVSVFKRLPWLQINLLTAFLAAAVVGIFEQTIAQFTALAVLLPVVAGQSGNTGAQALAVTMRGLALREIRISHWKRLLMKEARVGLLNGLAVALVTSLGVWLWSASIGLAGVIFIAMILSMVIASLAGASIPIILTRVGLDPAQSSSILLTTVTDVAGFFSFLGIATLLAGQL